MSQSREEPARVVMTNLQLFSSKSHPCCTPEDGLSWSLQPETPKHEKNRCTELCPNAQVSAHKPSPHGLAAIASCKKHPEFHHKQIFLKKRQFLVTTQVQACVPSLPSLLPSRLSVPWPFFLSY